VLIGDDTVAGSAQRRTRTAVLQHGSIIVERRYTQQLAAAVTDVADLDVRQLGERFVALFASRSSTSLEPGS